MRDDFSSSTTLAPGESRADRPGSRWILALALVFGLLRFWQLGEWSLWIDEAYTVADWDRGPGKLWNPLGYQVIRLGVGLLGGEASEWNLRLLPALAGWLCIPLSFWALRGVFGERRAAWVALLLALSSWHVFWSQTARFYTFAMAISLLGSGLTLRGLWSGSLVRALLGLAFAAAAAAFHPTAVLVVPALALAPLLVRARGASPDRGLAPQGSFDRVAKALLVLSVLVVLAASRWLWTSFAHHVVEKGTAELASGPRHLLLTCGYFFTPLVGLAAALGALWSWRARDAAGLFATAVCVLAMAGGFLISIFALMTAQYLFCLLPWALALALAPIDALFERARGRALVAAWCGVLMLSAALGSYLYMTSREGERPRWREAYELVDREREAGDLILGMAAPIGELYLGETGCDPRRTRTVSPLADWFPNGPRRWNRHPRRIWVVIRPQWLASLRDQDRALLEAWLRDEAQVVQRFPVEMRGRDLELVVYGVKTGLARSDGP